MRIALIAGLLAAGTSLAGNITLNGSNGPTITGIGCFESGVCFMLLSSPISTNDSSCSDRTQVRFSVDTTNARWGAPEMYRTALSAFLGKRPLVVNLSSKNDCLLDPYDGVTTHPKISFLFAQ